MSTVPQGLAEQLLEAQVQFVLAEVTGDRFTEVIAPKKVPRGAMSMNRKMTKVTRLATAPLGAL